jgi:prepilin-type N-terminal cleavage/methylation domain-containing protein
MSLSFRYIVALVCGGTLFRGVLLSRHLPPIRLRGSRDSLRQLERVLGVRVSGASQTRRNGGAQEGKMIAMIGTNGRRPARGFSLLELMIVVGITLVVAAVAIPKFLIATQDFKLRSTASGVSGLIQKCRMLAVARNATCPSSTCSQTGYYAVKYTTTSGVNYVFIDMDGSGTINATPENTNVLVPPSIVFDTAGGGFSLSSMSLSYTPVVSLPAFNARGLPCIVSGGACTVTGQGYIYYLRQDRAVSATGWAAVTVSPAGRAQVWTWDGSKWE